MNNVLINPVGPIIQGKSPALEEICANENTNKAQKTAIHSVLREMLLELYTIYNVGIKAAIKAQARSFQFPTDCSIP